MSESPGIINTVPVRAGSEIDVLALESLLHDQIAGLQENQKLIVRQFATESSNLTYFLKMGVEGCLAPTPAGHSSSKSS